MAKVLGFLTDGKVLAYGDSRQEDDWINDNAALKPVISFFLSFWKAKQVHHCSITCNLPASWRLGTPIAGILVPKTNPSCAVLVSYLCPLNEQSQSPSPKT